jgi:putative transcription factor
LSYYCEMCGRELEAREAKRAVVEGSLLILCPQCYQRLSKQGVAKEYMVTPTKQVRSRVSTSTPSRQQARRLEEYEVVEDYAVRIKTARERLGWSQEVLALKVGESVNTIKRIEASRLKPSIDLAKKLERVLGIKLLEPIVEEVGETRSSKGADTLTIGDLIRLNDRENA